MPDEYVFNALKVIINDFNKCTTCFSSAETRTSCELQSIIELDLCKSIPLFIQLLLDGLTFNKITETTTTTTIASLSNTAVHFDKIDQYINAIVKQLEKSYELLLKLLENTSFQKRGQEPLEPTKNDTINFPNDLSQNEQSPLQYYSVYTEFISYIYSLYLFIRSVLATLFNKAFLLIDNSEHTSGCPSTTKKSKKKAAERQSATNVVNENENEIHLWNQFEKIEAIFNQQWTQIMENIHKYELYIRYQAKLNEQECDRLEKELDENIEQQSNK